MRPPFVDGQPPPSAASNAPVGQEFRTWCGTTPPTLAISNMLRLQTEYSRSWQTGLDSNSASFRDGRLLLQFLAVVLSQLRNFRLDHYPAIGLSVVKNICRRSLNDMILGSNVISIDSACAVSPVHTSSYEGLGTFPPE